MTVTIEKASLSELERDKDFPALFGEYAEECAIEGLPAPDEKMAAYRTIEESGIYHVFGAYRDGRLIGFLCVLLPVIPHYGVAIGVSESFFVAKADRHGGAGLKLLAAAEEFASEAGAPALMVSAPTGGVLMNVLPRIGYRETNRVFMKGLSDA